MNNKFAWAAIAYAVYLGVKNWEQLQALQEQVDKQNSWLYDAVRNGGGAAL